VALQAFVIKKKDISKISVADRILEADRLSRNKVTSVLKLIL
jgi:hypothetical protein